jgi:transcriptional regulator with XRE-family HTH domain
MALALSASRTSFGDHLRDWRQRRRLSQMELGLRAGVSSKHVSFIETGRSRPSPEMVLHLAEHLGVPVRQRNSLLLAAGHAPRYPETPLDDATMTAARRAVEMLLQHHQPFPAVVVDRRWDLVAANPAALLLTTGVHEELLGPPMNVVRLSTHPLGLAPRMRNFAEYGAHMVDRLEQQVARTADPELAALLDEVRTYVPVAHEPPSPALGVLLPLVLDVDGEVLSLFSTITTFGTAIDITLSELAIESFFPADEATERWFRARDGDVGTG